MKDIKTQTAVLRKLNMFIVSDCAAGDVLGPDAIPREKYDSGDIDYTSFLAVSQVVSCHGVIKVSGQLPWGDKCEWSVVM